MRRLYARANPIVAGLAALALVCGCIPSAAPTATPPASGSGPPIASPIPSPPVGDSPIALVIDTDMAPDDVVAIASLLRDPAVDVLAITVTGTGEAHCPGGMFVARSMVTMLVDEDVPVACGPAAPLGPAQPFPEAWRAGADAGNGLALVSPRYAPETVPAQRLLVDLAATEASAGRRLTILTLGTLTNVAAAVELEPDLPAQVRIVSMLGAVDVPGNVTPDVAGGSGEPTAEWNAHADPTAVRRVLEAGFDWTLVPLDATNRVPMTEDLYRRLESDHEAGPADLVFELWSKNTYMWSSAYYLWDPVAAIALRRPNLVTTREATLRVVEGAGLDGGRLVEDAAGHSVTIATSAERDGVEASLLSALRIGGPREGGFQIAAIALIAIGDRTCEARLEPADATSGTFRFELTNLGPAEILVQAFGLGSVTWAEAEAFAAEVSASGPSSPLLSPPPVIEIGGVQVGPGSTGTMYGNVPPGDLGVACIFGPLDGPDVVLAGPLAIGP